MKHDGKQQDGDVFVAGGGESRVKDIGFGGWQLASIIASPAGI